MTEEELLSAADDMETIIIQIIISDPDLSLHQAALLESMSRDIDAVRTAFRFGETDAQRWAWAKRESDRWNL